MTTKTETAVTTQVYQVYIKASPEAIWEAITSPDWTDKYGYKGRNALFTNSAPRKFTSSSTWPA